MLTLGGFHWKIGGDPAARKHVLDQGFTAPLPFPGEEISLELFAKPHSPSPQDDLIIETDRTWKLYRTQQADFPYRISPSRKVGFDSQSLHLYASEDFRRLQLHYGKWKQLPESPWIFYPYEQTVMIHLCQFLGSASLMHASAVFHENKGYLFLGDSGAGKSSIAELLETRLGAGKIFSDDRVVIQKVDGKWWVFGTPWNGTFPRSRTDGVEIGGMYFLEKSEQNRLAKPKALLTRLLPVTFATWWLPQKMDRYFSFLAELSTQTQFPMEEFHFAKDLSAADYLGDAWK
jgi:hypothetical protein